MPATTTRKRGVHTTHYRKVKELRRLIRESTWSGQEIELYIKELEKLKRATSDGIIFMP